MERFFAKQHYQWGKVQTFAGRLRVKTEDEIKNLVAAETLAEDLNALMKKAL